MRYLIAMFVLFLVAAPAAAADRDDVMNAVTHFIEAFNKGDAKLMTAACADQTSIIDEFPPHEWHGPGACLQWLADYDTDAKKNGITDGWVSVGKPKHLDVNGDRAYVVIPATYKFKLKGKPVTESGAMFTVALRKSEGTWRAVGWAWPKP